jgi:cytochrome c
VGAGVRLNPCRAVAMAALLAASGCGERAPTTDLAGGEPGNGKLLLRQYACGSCHIIPGVANARGNVGPPLQAIGSRIYESIRDTLQAGQGHDKTGS